MGNISQATNGRFYNNYCNDSCYGNNLYTIYHCTCACKKYSDEKNDYDSDSVIISRAIAIITGALLVLIVPFCLDNIVTGFVNPEYGALMDILEKLGGQ